MSSGQVDSNKAAFNKTFTNKKSLLKTRTMSQAVA